MGKARCFARMYFAFLLAQKKHPIPSHKRDHILVRRNGVRFKRSSDGFDLTNLQRFEFDQIRVAGFSVRQAAGDDDAVALLRHAGIPGGNDGVIE